MDSAPDFIPVSTVRFGSAVEEAVLGVLRSGQLAQGPRVAELERRFAEAFGLEQVIAVNSGTTALVAALSVLDLEPGDEVVTSPFTFAASLSSIVHTGAVARFADISEDDFLINAAAVEPVLTSRSKVLLPVHLYGQPADMGQLAEIVGRYSLRIVEDAAQAPGAAFDGRYVGSWDVGCFSLYATKNLTSGEGGLISTRDAMVADRLRVLRNQGMRDRYQYVSLGHNYRLTDLQAAICLPQLEAYPETVRRRQNTAAALTAELESVAWLKLPTVRPGRSHVWHQYTVLLAPDAPIARDELVTLLHRHGIGSGIYYPRVVFDYGCFRDHPQVVADEVPVARSVAQNCLSLPVHPGVGVPEVARIAAAIKAVGRR